MYRRQLTYRVSDDIVERLRAKDPTLVNDLTLDGIVGVYNDSQKNPGRYGGHGSLLFMAKVLIPEKTAIIKKLLSREEWESIVTEISYSDYIVILLNYFGNRDDKEGIEKVKKLIIKEKVDRFSTEHLRTSNPYVLKLLIDFRPRIVRGIFDKSDIKGNI